MIDDAEALLGYRFNDPRLLSEALTHASSADHRLQSNERMEFLGDTILGFVVAEYLFKTYPDDLEGELTKIKSAVVSRKICANMTLQMNLHRLLSLGKGMSNRPTLPSSVAAAVFESIIAAIYLDGGLEPARVFILQHVVPHISETAKSAHQQNFKSLLQQHAQKSLPSNPVYVLLDEKGPDHSKAFEICVEINGRRFDSAWDNSKKEAEQKAALFALRALKLVAIDSDGQVMLTGPELAGRSSRSSSNGVASNQQSKEA